MSAYTPNRSAREVDAELRRSLTELETAQRNAVLWFAEVLKRKLYVELGCSSIHQYARERLGFSAARTSQFLELARALESLPALRRSVARGEVAWTKAREVARVATPRTEAFWVEQARTTGRRELERRVAEVRARAKAAGNDGQLGLESAATATVEADGLGPAPAAESGFEAPGASGVAAAAKEVPVDVRLRFTPEQYARFEALLAAAAKQGHAHGREETLLAALEALAVGESAIDFPRGNSAPDRGTASPTAPADFPRGKSAPRYQVVVQHCPACGKAEVIGSARNRPLTLHGLQAVLCDARIQGPDGHNRATIPPARRRQALARDGHRCRARGCGSTHCLDVHHVVPRDRGGSNNLDNLVTLCAPCHG